jgi:AraC-like DNA-binding protein
MDYKKNSRTLSLEFDRSWLSENGFSSKHFNWNGMVTDPEMKFILIKILNEQRFDDEVCTLSMQTMALKLVTMLTTAERDVDYMLPWVAKIKDLLNDQWNEVPSLEYLSRQLSIHPVTISRYFPKFFGCTMGDYLRKIKVDKSLYLLKQAKMCNWEIALECGFSDSSHFNRVFKTYTGISPTEFRGI